MSDTYYNQFKLDKFWDALNTFTEFLVNLTPLYIQILLWWGVGMSSHNATAFIALTAAALAMLSTGLTADHFSYSYRSRQSYLEEVKKTAIILAVVFVAICVFVAVLCTPEKKAAFFSIAWLNASVTITCIIGIRLFDVAKDNRDFPASVGIIKFIADSVVGCACALSGFVFWKLHLYGNAYFSDEHIRYLVYSASAEWVQAIKFSVLAGLGFASIKCAAYVRYIRQDDAAVDTSLTRLRLSYWLAVLDVLSSRAADAAERGEQFGIGLLKIIYGGGCAFILIKYLRYWNLDGTWPAIGSICWAGLTLTGIGYAMKGLDQAWMALRPDHLRFTDADKIKGDAKLKTPEESLAAFNRERSAADLKRAAS